MEKKKVKKRKPAFKYNAKSGFGLTIFNYVIGGLLLVSGLLVILVSIEKNNAYLPVGIGAIVMAFSFFSMGVLLSNQVMIKEKLLMMEQREKRENENNKAE